MTSPVSPQESPLGAVAAHPTAANTSVAPLTRAMASHATDALDGTPENFKRFHYAAYARLAVRPEVLAIKNRAKDAPFDYGGFALLMRDHLDELRSVSHIQRIAEVAALVNAVDAPAEILFIDPEIAETFGERTKGGPRIGIGTYVTPGALIGLSDALPEVARKKVLVSIGSGSNVQEGTALVWKEGDGLFPLGSKAETAAQTAALAAIVVRVGDDASIAHQVQFALAPGVAKARFAIGNRAFVGIGATLGSDSQIAQDVTIGHGAQIGFRVTVAKNSLVGVGARVDEDMFIPENSLVPNAAHIAGACLAVASPEEAKAVIAAGNAPRIAYREYLAHREAYDRACARDNRPCLVLDMRETGGGSDAKVAGPNLEGFKAVDDGYAFLGQFGAKMVVPENLTFARVDRLMNVLSKILSPNLSRWLVEERRIEHANPAATVDGVLARELERGRDLSHLRKELLRAAQPGASSVLMLARPKNNEDFIANGYVDIMDAHGRGADESEMLALFAKYFYRPEIDPNAIILGRNAVAGRVAVDGNSVLAYSCLRGDELKDHWIISIADSTLWRVVGHGHGNKTVEEESFVGYATVHNATSVRSSAIGTKPGAWPSIANDADLKSCQAPEGGFVANATAVEHGELSRGGVYAGRKR